MKYRKDFVTNSSSSSFVCDICGAVESGWDYSLSEVGMVECVNGHTICESEMLQALMDDDRYNIPEESCPICQFIEYSQNDMAQYLEKKYGVSRADVFAEVKKVNRRRKKLYDSEYITHVCKMHDLDPIQIASGWKSEFGSYKEFSEKFLK